VDLTQASAWPLKLKLVVIIFKHLVLISEKKKHLFIIFISWPFPFKEIIAVYSENYTKHINTICGENAILVDKAGGSYV
jgi:hypothetical protein